MKKSTLALLCYSAFLYACDGSKDTTTNVVDSAKESASAAMDAAGDAATKAIAEGKDLKDIAVESSNAAVDSVKDISSTETTKTENVVTSASTGDPKQGESIYKGKCVACHSTGVAGAPKLDDKAAWAPRIAQGNTVLTQHAIEGFKGNTGYMPPKGGYMNLSDEEISKTVQYMVSQAQ